MRFLARFFFDPIIAPPSRLFFSLNPASFHVYDIAMMSSTDHANEEGAKRTVKTKVEAKEEETVVAIEPFAGRRVFCFFFFLKTLFVPLQFLLVPEAGVQREFLIVADAPELGVRVRRVAELESRGLLFFFFFSFSMMMVDGRGEERKTNVSLSRFRASCVLPLEPQQTAQRVDLRMAHTHARTSAQRDPVRLSGGCMQPEGKAKKRRETKKKAKSARLLSVTTTDRQRRCCWPKEEAKQIKKCTHKETKRAKKSATNWNSPRVRAPRR